MLDLLADSPFKLLREHMAIATACAHVLKPYFDAFCREDWSDTQRLFDDAKALEHEADALKQKVRFHLYQNNLMLILSKGDTIRLLSSQDQIANQSRDIMGNLLGRQFVIPNPKAQQTLKDLAAKAVEACDMANSITQDIAELMKNSWSKKEKKAIYKKLDALDQLESENDQLQRELRQILYGLEAQLRPIDAMFLYGTLRTLGALADTAQNVGHRLLLLLA